MYVIWFQWLSVFQSQIEKHDFKELDQPLSGRKWSSPLYSLMVFSVRPCGTQSYPWQISKLSMENYGSYEGDNRGQRERERPGNVSSSLTEWPLPQSYTWERNRKNHWECRTKSTCLEAKKSILLGQEQGKKNILCEFPEAKGAAVLHK